MRSASAMHLVARWASCALVLLLVTRAEGAPRFDPATADAQVAEARKGGLNAFCSAPSSPLSPRARDFCSEAKEIADCPGLVEACGADEKPKAPSDTRWLEWIARVLGPIARVVVYGALAAAIGVIVWLLVAAILRAKRDRAAIEEPAVAPAEVLPEAVDEVVRGDAEVLLRRAEAHAARGELDRAAVTYLAASLAALDRKGALRLGRDRTHGEYVRACSDPAARQALRDIVRAVDRVEYGGEAPTPETVSEVAARATHLVRAAVVLAAMVLAFGGCDAKGASERGADPAGDEVFFALLARQGATAKHLSTSIATLPLPAPHKPSPVVVLDVGRVPLEDDARAHLGAWVEAGGFLVLAGDPGAWPAELGAKRKVALEAEIALDVPAPRTDQADDDDDDGDALYTHYDVHLARGAALEWNGSFGLGRSPAGATWAARKVIGRGIVLGLASNDLLTNAGLARAPNAAALMALLEPWSGREIQVARNEDGIAPPSNPLSALLRAGLGLPLAHAAVAVLVLLLAYGVRHARARPTPPPTRRRWTEHLEATGGLYARARLATHALAAYARFVDGRVRARMPRGYTDPAAFLAFRANAPPGQCAAVWARATAARSDDKPRGDELATLRALSALYAAAMKAD